MNKFTFPRHVMDAVKKRPGAMPGVIVTGARQTGKFDITGKPLKGWIMVLSDALDEDDNLNGWLQKAVSFVRSLPPK